MSATLDLVARVVENVWLTVAHTWVYVVVSITAAAAISVYVGTERIARTLRCRPALAVVGAVAVATLTPLCSCGTVAVLLGMMATTVPWAPLVAFIVSSPLTSPGELVFSAGLFGWTFALVLFVGTILVGLLGGGIAAVLDRLGWLRDQARMRPSRSVAVRSPDCGTERRRTGGPGGTASGVLLARPATLVEQLRLVELAHEVLTVGRRLVVVFVGFTALSYLMVELIPTSWITSYVGDDSAWAVPIGALLGLPAYVNSEASLPLVAGLMDGGMGPGAAMAFIITGAGTSIGALSGLLLIARWRVVALCVGVLFAGSIALGVVVQLLMA